jgi:hypothetical protein
MKADTPMADLCYLGGWKSPLTVMTVYQQADQVTLGDLPVSAAAAPAQQNAATTSAYLRITPLGGWETARKCGWPASPSRWFIDSCALRTKAL